MDDPDASRDWSRRRDRPGRQIRLGVGTADALAKLLAAALLSGLLVISFVQRWNPFFIIVIAIVWAIVTAGLVLAPMMASFFADFLSQHGARNPTAARDLQKSTPGWADTREPRPTAGDIGLRLTPSKGPMVRPQSSTIVSGFDWEGLVQAVASRIEEALGHDFTTESKASALVLRHGEMVRTVNLGSIFQPPPLDVSERALRGCLKMMDESQMFAMRVGGKPWPTRAASAEGGPVALARPRVRLDEGQIRMMWADSSGVVVRLRPLPFGELPPVRQDSSSW